jgi:PEP-CTERM motif
LTVKGALGALAEIPTQRERTMKLKFSIQSLTAALCSAAALSAMSTAALAGPISIANASFEDAVQSTPGYLNPAGITSWATTGTTGVWNPTLTPPSYATYWSTPLPDGKQIGFTTGGTIAQTLGTTYATGSLYTLTVAFGNRLDGPWIPTNVKMQLFSDTAGSVIATQDISVGTIDRGTFKDFTLSYTALAADNGKAIGIRFTSEGQQLDIDNVRLNNVPEPGTLILLGSALAGIGMTRRRKQG